MKAIITTDSEILDKRLLTILTGISGLEISASVKNVQEAFIFIKNIKPDVLIISPHHLTLTDFDSLKEIRVYNENLLIIILTSDTSSEYVKMWESAGANFVFDQAIQINKLVDVLCSILYKKHFNAIQTENSLNKIGKSHL